MTINFKAFLISVVLLLCCVYVFAQGSPVEASAGQPLPSHHPAEITPAKPSSASSETIPGKRTPAESEALVARADQDELSFTSFLMFIAGIVLLFGLGGVLFATR
jgi:hypothetical protein